MKTGFSRSIGSTLLCDRLGKSWSSANGNLELANCAHRTNGTYITGRVSQRIHMCNARPVPCISWCSFITVWGCSSVGVGYPDTIGPLYLLNVEFLTKQCMVECKNTCLFCISSITVSSLHCVLRLLIVYEWKASKDWHQQSAGHNIYPPPSANHSLSMPSFARQLAQKDCKKLQCLVVVGVGRHPPMLVAPPIPCAPSRPASRSPATHPSHQLATW